MKITAALAFATLWLPPTSPAVAQGHPAAVHNPDSSDVALVLAQERALWEAWKNHDLAAIEHFTAADYYSVNEDGPDHAVGLAEIRADFPRYALRDYRLGEMVGRVLAPGVIAVVYNAYIFGTYDGEDISRGVSEASIWIERDGVWRTVLLQEITRPNRDEAVDP